MLPKTNAYVKIMMHKLNECILWLRWYLLKRYNTVWDKASADIKNDFDSKLVYNKEFLKTKIKSHGDEIADFYDKKTLRLILIILV